MQSSKVAQLAILNYDVTMFAILNYDVTIFAILNYDVTIFPILNFDVTTPTQSSRPNLVLLKSNINSVVTKV